VSRSRVPRPRSEGAEIDFGASVVKVSIERDSVVAVGRCEGGDVMKAYWAVSPGRSADKVGLESESRFCVPLAVRWAIWLPLCMFIAVKCCVLDMEG
jgi:hypothetical protein